MAMISNLQASPARLLAALIDLFLIRVLAGTFLPSNNWGLGTFALAALYFSLGNSEFMGGGTPGKKLFGLKVLSINTGNHIGLGKSFLRYLAYPGLIILLIELPQIYFRANGLIASPYLLESNMLLAMLVFIGSVFLILFSKAQMGLHDWIASTSIARLNEEHKAKQGWSKPESLSVSLGACFALSLWLFGVNQPEPVKQLSSHRYHLERENPYRIAGSQIHNSVLQIAVFFLKDLTEEELVEKIEILSNSIIDSNILSAERSLSFFVRTPDGRDLQFNRDSNEKKIVKVETSRISNIGNAKEP